MEFAVVIPLVFAALAFIGLAATVFTEGNNPGDWLKWEDDGQYSRETVTLIAGAGDLKTGTVLGKITASGKYAQFDQDENDGTEAAAGVLLLDTDASGSDDVEAAIIRRQAVVSQNGLTWPDDISGGEQTTAEAQLVALGILVREGA